MRTKTSGDYLSNRAWLRDVVGDNDLIICGISALEFLQLFVGYINESVIDVYSTSKGIYENIRYHIVENFDNIETVRYGNVLCTSVNQTINDLLSNNGEVDELALTEALSTYYYSHNKSFDGLSIRSSNTSTFNRLSKVAIEYYCGG